MISILTKRNLDACVSLYVETFNAPPWNESWRIDDAIQRLGDALATPRAYGVCMSAADDELLGFALGHRERSVAEDHFLLREMCVRPAPQRQGHGTALLEALADRMPGVRRWYLLTARDSDASAFYERNGFRPLDGWESSFVPEEARCAKRGYPLMLADRALRTVTLGLCGLFTVKVIEPASGELAVLGYIGASSTCA